jgi:UDP-N-acetylmuramoyl-L-alanyl-D-glutamate--2,6-diaminopimelate ligase
MRILKDILKGVAVRNRYGSQEVELSAVVFDSRKVVSKALFVAQKGVSFDGHLFVEKAISSGASVVVCQAMPQKLNDAVTYVEVQNSNVALAKIAANYFDNPSAKLKLIGITGTNGKTTVATLMYNLFQKSGYKAGLLSTVKIKVGADTYKATHTTPDSVAINHYLAKMVDEQVTHCFMEVSSHGIHQSRTEALEFDGGVFTNLTHDHLDYHNTFLEYRDVKKKFFDTLSKEAFALVNKDDKNGQIMLQNTLAGKASYALKTMADFKVKILEKGLSGMLLNVNQNEIWCRLIGDFNAYNLAAVYGTASLLGLPSEKVLRAMSTLENVDGRFQYEVSNGGIVSIVDYAHTPDALKNILETIAALRPGKESIITVMGCGGNRDKTKRAKMGKIAAALSDQVIFTSDNPRYENPQAIIDEIEAGVQSNDRKKTLAIVDRKQAIKTAIRFAEEGDIVLVAGKGHETYQDIEGVKINFDDREVLSKVLKEFEK